MRGGLGSDRVKDSASEHRAVAKGAKRESRRSENSQILMLPKVRRFKTRGYLLFKVTGYSFKVTLRIITYYSQASYIHRKNTVKNILLNNKSGTGY